MIDPGRKPLAEDEVLWVGFNEAALLGLLRWTCGRRNAKDRTRYMLLEADILGALNTPVDFSKPRHTVVGHDDT